MRHWIISARIYQIAIIKRVVVNRLGLYELCIFNDFIYLIQKLTNIAVLDHAKLTFAGYS